MLQRKQDIVQVQSIRRSDKDRVDLRRGAQSLRRLKGMLDLEIPRVRLGLGKVPPPQPNQTANAQTRQMPELSALPHDGRSQESRSESSVRIWLWGY